MTHLSPRMRLETVPVPVLPEGCGGRRQPETSQSQARRRRDGLQIMHARGDLTDALFWAAEQFRDDHAAALGASPGRPLTAIAAAGRGSAARGPGHEPAERQLIAIRRLRAAAQAVPTRAQAVFAWVVIDWKTLGAYERAHHMRNGRARPWLIEALDALADHYAGGQHPRAGQTAPARHDPVMVSAVMHRKTETA